MATPANLALEGGDPRRPDTVRIGDVHIDASGTGTKVYDPNVTFEEYLYHARISRADERYETLNPDYELFGVKIKSNSQGGMTPAQHIMQVMGGETALPSSPNESENGVGEKTATEDKTISTVSSPPPRYGVSNEEYTQASRAVRTAGWSAIFFLITTDILGPFGLPTAFAYTGFGPGIALYTVFAFLAMYNGLLLWRMYMQLDSDRYPMKTYGDIAYRLFGTWARYFCSVLQFIQLLFAVAILITLNGLSLEQIIVGSGRNAVCYIILPFIWAVAGAIFGQVRSLKNIGWVGNLSVWLNVFTIIMIMAIVPRYPPLYDAAAAVNGPLLGYDENTPHQVKTYAGTPPGTDFNVQLSGLQVAIYAYGGATVFIELMSEMRRPFDFWKGMICAQIFIYGFYMLFGVFVYAFQGQYAINPAYQSISPYGWQTAGNAIQLVTSFIAAMLYGNVGIKVAYNAVLRDIFKFPDLATRSGKLAWVGVVPVFWAVAFVIGGAIPQITNLQGVIAAIAIIQFSYTFPPLFFLGFAIKRDSMLPGDGFDPATGRTIRADSGLKRHWRGFKTQWKLNTWHLVFVLGALATCGLGLYAAIKGVIAAYAQGSQSSFSCHSIYNPA